LYYSRVVFKKEKCNKNKLDQQILNLKDQYPNIEKYIIIPKVSKVGELTDEQKYSFLE
jgi:hypothetical protein